MDLPRGEDFFLQVLDHFIHSSCNPRQRRWLVVIGREFAGQETRHRAYALRNRGVCNVFAVTRR